MQKAIIEWIKPHCFRAFGDPDPIVFEDQLTIFFGGNGSGKSSLAEAIEWLLFGYTTRRRKGDDLSREEYRGSYARNMQNCPSTPFVEAKIRLSGGHVHVIRRTMLLSQAGRFDDTQSELAVDGVPTVFDSIGLAALPVYNPVVTQHGIQDFIHTRPIERYRTISDALGLTDLVGLKDALDSARTTYKGNLPDLVTQAFADIRPLPGHLRDLGLAEIATRWSGREYRIEEDYEKVLPIALDLAAADKEFSFSELQVALQEKQTAEMRRVFDVSPFRPRADSDNLLEELHEKQCELDSRIGEFTEAAQKVIQATLTEFEEKRIAFWRTGLELFDPESPDRCPFCDERTVTQQLLNKRGSQVDRAKGMTKARKDLTRTADACKGIALAALQLLGQIRIKSLSANDMATLKEVFDSNQEALNAFFDNCAEFGSVTEEAYRLVGSVEKRVEVMKSNVLTLNAVEVPTHARKLTQDFANAVSRFSTAFEIYRQSFLEFEPVLRVELADEEEVKRYTAAIALLEKRESVRICSINHQLEEDLLEQQRAVSSYVRAKQQEVLNVRESEMLNWYHRLTPGATTTFSGIEPATDRFVLKANCFGNELSAPACLSHSQLNCLGLSIWIPSVTAPLSPFQFLLFDDPVQAMDDEHAESFIMNIVPQLIEQEGIQVIVLTHLMRIADRLREDHYHMHHRYYHFDSLTSDGVRLFERYLIKDEIGHIKKLMVAGDEASRALAVDRIRVLCEHIVREAYLVEHGQPLPEKYAVARPSELLKPLNALASVEQRQKQAIVASIKWSDPAHHTDKSWQVPLTSHITPHLDRLASIVTALGLVP